MGGTGGPTQRTAGYQSPLMKAGITGFAVVGEMLTGGLFMENVKMEKQRTSLSYPSIMRTVLRQGLKGFWAGFWPWGFILGSTKGSVLGGARAFFLESFQTKMGMEKGRADLLSGFCAGGVQGIAMSPVLLARTRVNQSLTERAARSTDGMIKTGFIAELKASMLVLNEGVKKEGWSILFRGMPTMICKRALDWGTRFIFIGMYEDWFKRMRSKDKLEAPWKLAASFVGGATSCAVTMPLDRLMPILQQAGASKEGVAHFLRRKIAEEGVTTLQRGFLMRMVHTGYHTVFAVFVADRLYALMT